MDVGDVGGLSALKAAQVSTEAQVSVAKKQQHQQAAVVGTLIAGAVSEPGKGEKLDLKV